MNEIRDRQKEGYLQEKIVAGLERCIDSDAEIVANIRLPVLGAPKRRPRQIDVLIRQGEEPRQHLSIVEVQKRKSKVGPDQLNGWLQKMREVGAQHLICVSESGFSSGAKIIADQTGPTIRLLTLKEMEVGTKIHLPHFSPKIEYLGRIRVKKFFVRVGEDVFMAGIHFSGNDDRLILPDGERETVGKFVENNVIYRCKEISDSMHLLDGKPLRIVGEGGGLSIDING